MGGSFSILPLQEPMWFSYYGPIRQAEASEALDAAITSHLQEIGDSSSIPIRKEIADQVVVPVALNSPPFSEKNANYILHYATSMPGKLIFSKISAENDEENRQDDAEKDKPINIEEFGIGLDLSYSIPSSYEGTYSIQFVFDVSKGVSSRIFLIKFAQNAQPTVIDDKVVADGVTSSVSRVFQEEADQNGETDFSDGLCLICCTNPATVIAFPCRHCCMCRSCSEKFAALSNHCPVCRAVVHELIDCSTSNTFNS